MSVSNPLGMSDEDFLNAAPPEFVPDDKSESQPEADPEKEAAASTSEDTVDQDAEVVGDDASPEKEEEKDEIETDTPAEAAAKAEDTNKEEVKNDKPETKTEGEADPAPKVEEAKPVEVPNYEAFFTQVMTPFKANGKMIELKTPEEAIQLMQMGANYARKMQDIVPHRKVLMMLEKNGLLDESKLSFLIDVEKKDPEAIRKLVKDSGLDVHDIDTSQEPKYQAGNHQVSDEAVTFHTALGDLRSSNSGKETIKHIDVEWDTTSKEVLWKSPEIMAIIHEQRESGVYARIADEISRQRTLGKIAPETSFLSAYKTVGDEMVAAKAFDDLVAPASTATKTDKPAARSPTTGSPVAVATRVAAPKAAVSNGDKAASASTTRASTAKTKEFINPLSMSDAEFEKISKANV